MKISEVDAKYLLDYLQLCEKVASKGPGALMDIHTYEEWQDEDGQWQSSEDDLESPGFALLENLNEQARKDGVTETLIRTKFIAQDALSNKGAWYSSTTYCNVGYSNGNAIWAKELEEMEGLGEVEP